MIIVRLTGGLGNQLFQYAAALRLAHATGSSLKLDILSYRRDPLRSYALDAFRISAAMAETREIALFQGREKMRSGTHSLYRRIPLQFRRWQWVRQSSLYFHPEILDLEGDVYLDGSWQSQKYFEDAAGLIRTEFTLKDKIACRTETISREILSTNAVSMHIRRGDYIENPVTRSIHDVCSLDYYERSLSLLTAMEPNPHIFVFSDDKEWVHQNVRFPYPISVVDHNSPVQAHDDLRLMSLCRYHVIANSSFSWWGAWLSPYPDKKVFAPGRWFNAEGYDISDFVPADWQLVKV